MLTADSGMVGFEQRIGGHAGDAASRGVADAVASGAGGTTSGANSAAVAPKVSRALLIFGSQTPRGSTSIKTGQK